MAMATEVIVDEAPEPAQKGLIPFRCQAQIWTRIGHSEPKEHEIHWCNKPAIRKVTFDRITYRFCEEHAQQLRCLFPYVPIGFS